MICLINLQIGDLLKSEKPLKEKREKKADFWGLILK